MWSFIIPLNVGMCHPHPQSDQILSEINSKKYFSVTTRLVRSRRPHKLGNIESLRAGRCCTLWATRLHCNTRPGSKVVRNIFTLGQALLSEQAELNIREKKRKHEMTLRQSNSWTVQLSPGDATGPVREETGGSTGGQQAGWGGSEPDQSWQQL